MPASQMKWACGVTIRVVGRALSSAGYVSWARRDTRTCAWMTRFSSDRKMAVPIVGPGAGLHRATPVWNFGAVRH